jgi:hypothetical protein
VLDLGTHQPTWRQSVQVLLLAAGPTAIVSHRTAAHLLGLADLPRPRRVDVTVARGRHDETAGVRLHTTVRMLDGEAVTSDGLRATSASRTLVDLAGHMTTGWLDLALADALRRDLTTETALLDSIALRPGLSSGRHVLRRLAALPGGIQRAESPLEVRAVLRLTSLGIVPEAFQHRVRGADGRTHRVDLAWPSRRLAVEVDGRRWHETRATADAARTRSLRSAGWTVVRLSDPDVRDTASSAAVRRLHRILA